MNLRYRIWKVPLGQRKKGREESLAYMHTHSSSQLCLHTQFDVMSAKAVYGCDSEFTPLRRHLFFGVRSRTTFSRIQKGARKKREKVVRGIRHFL